MNCHCQFGNKGYALIKDGDKILYVNLVLLLISCLFSLGDAEFPPSRRVLLSLLAGSGIPQEKYLP